MVNGRNTSELPHAVRTFGWLAAFFFCCPCICVSDDGAPPVKREGGQLVYSRDALGNQVPDFSHCGYRGGDQPIPQVPAEVTVAPSGGDSGRRLQAAIDYVAGLPADEEGFRGAVQLAPGKYDIRGQLVIRSAGVVLRGAGAGDQGTTLRATGNDRRTLIRIAGTTGRETNDAVAAIVDEYVPVGARQFRIDDASNLKVGDEVVVTRPSTNQWIKELGMDAFGVSWKPGTRDVRWGRTITAINGQLITLDAPITIAMEKRFGGGTLAKCDWPGRITNIGIEDLQLVSDYSRDNPLDEEHAWHGVTFENARDGWVRRVEFRHFAGGAVAVWETADRVTVEDCISREPISEFAGYRRHTFFTQGGRTLFLRCWSEQGMHDFTVGHCAAGPNAFVNCYAADAHGDSGPIESWASGVLYDNVRIDGAGLNLENRWVSPPSAGWSAANSVIWQCQAATMRCFQPPTARNWVNGVWTRYAGDAKLWGESDFVDPKSLYQAQVAARLGKEAADQVGPFLLRPVSATNPDLDAAARFVAQSQQPPKQLHDVIRERIQGSDGWGRRNLKAVSIDDILASADASSTLGESREEHPPRSLKVQNGWLVADGKLLTGQLVNPQWWRGTTRPTEAASYGPSLTRFVPGRTGLGYTDDLRALAHSMKASGSAALEHHHGLWYDRRRDDHLMVRRSTGDVAPPFYEQPFARTGIGTAWDGLSKYDLRKPNPWYWQRLREFAGRCDHEGLALLHLHYFQHNILEAGGHWADCPWRPANNVNDTGLPEPPPYVGDKRVFLAEQFYDVSNPNLRELHRGYIRQCLEGMGNATNVIHLTSAEFTGSLEFAQFWVDTIAEWEHEAGKNVLLGLSATKDVQDAILSDPQRSPHVDVIDIRYWTYTRGGALYAPAGGKSLSPRQHLRRMKPAPISFASILRSIREYRQRFPDKAVTYFADKHSHGTRDGWAVLMGGGSLANISALPSDLARHLPKMLPVEGITNGNNAWCLAGDEHYLVYSESNQQVLHLQLPDRPSGYRARWLDPATGAATAASLLTAEKLAQLPANAPVLWLATGAAEKLSANRPVPAATPKVAGRPVN